MNLSEEELRRQRRLLQQHLDWIDEKIRQFESADSDQTGPAADPPAHAPIPFTDLPEKKPAPPPGTPEVVTPVDPSPVGEKEVEPDLPREYLEGPRNDAASVKTGCILIFILVTLIPLFLLFGLPYLLD